MIISPQLGLMFVSALALYVACLMKQRVSQAGWWRCEDVSLAYEGYFGGDVRIGGFCIPVLECKERGFRNRNDSPSSREDSSACGVERNARRSLRMYRQGGEE
jgi:hypothetical protein